MKRYKSTVIAFALTLMLCFCLTACGNKSQDEATENVSVTINNAQDAGAGTENAAPAANTNTSNPSASEKSSKTDSGTEKAETTEASPRAEDEAPGDDSEGDGGMEIVEELTVELEEGEVGGGM
ncbi:MAG: hypothetical protein IKF90_02535 [Parasporobacterium sp.]|nr:hypothetical protein [Parasporobacterium sp.]